ncbi:MAG: YtxH domain-containing protein [Muribaculaceae bacterium]|nr:YtxH domain-containing protein [Muribaculaceae bacterium]
MACYENNHNGLFAFLGGAVIGGLAALLLAPQKGEITRRQLRSRLQAMRSSVYLTETEVTEMLSEFDSETDEGVSDDELGEN